MKKKYVSPDFRLSDLRQLMAMCDSAESFLYWEDDELQDEEVEW